MFSNDTATVQTSLARKLDRDGKTLAQRKVEVAKAARETSKLKSSENVRKPATRS